MVSGDKEAQGPVGIVAEPDAGGDSDVELRRAGGGVDRESAPGDIGSILAEVDVEGSGEAAGTFSGLRGMARDFDCADEHAAGAIFRFGYDVQAVVHAVDQVDVGMAGRPENHFRARSDAAEGVGGGVGKAQIGLRLDDTGNGVSMHQIGAEERPRYLDGRAGVETSRKRVRFIDRACR